MTDSHTVSIPQLGRFRPEIFGSRLMGNHHDHSDYDFILGVHSHELPELTRELTCQDFRLMAKTAYRYLSAHLMIKTADGHLLGPHLSSYDIQVFQKVTYDSKVLQIIVCSKEDARKRLQTLNSLKAILKTKNKQNPVLLAAMSQLKNNQEMWTLLHELVDHVANQQNRFIDEEDVQW